MGTFTLLFGKVKVEVGSTQTLHCTVQIVNRLLKRLTLISAGKSFWIVEECYIECVNTIRLLELR